MFNQLSDVQRGRLFNVILAVFILLAVFLGAEAINAFKENGYIGRGEYAANIISINGTGEVTAVPDVGTFTFSVIEEGKSVSEAQSKATKKSNAIIDAIKALGIAEKDIKTTGYNSYPKYEYPNLCANGYCPPQKQVLTGYEVNQSVSVKVRKTADAGGVLTKVGDLGATNISGLNFIVDKIEVVQAEARDKAIKDAKAKAEILSKSLGVKIVRIVSFNEGGNYPIFYARDAKTSAGVENQASAPTPPQLPTGENTVTSNVTITYEVQ